MKKIFILILSVVLCFSYIGCASENKDNKETTGQSSEISDKSNENQEEKPIVEKIIDEESDKNTDSSNSSDDNKTSSANEDTDSYKNITNDNKDKVQGSWKDSNSSDIYNFNSDGSYSCQSDIPNEEGSYWWGDENNELLMYIYVKGTAHPSSYIVKYKDDNNIQLVDPSDSSNVLTLIRQV